MRLKVPKKKNIFDRSSSQREPQRISSSSWEQPRGSSSSRDPAAQSSSPRGFYSSSGARELQQLSQEVCTRDLKGYDNVQ